MRSTFDRDDPHVGYSEASLDVFCKVLGYMEMQSTAKQGNRKQFITQQRKLMYKRHAQNSRQLKRNSFVLRWDYFWF